MRDVITSRFVEAAKPKRNEADAAVRTEYPDAACPGLYLVVQPSGTRSWAFRFRHQGVTGKKTLGSAAHDGLSLSAARAAAATWRHQLEQGVTMPGQRADVTGVTGKSGGGGDSIETAVASFLELHARRKNRPSTVWASERIFNRRVLPAWRGRSIDSIRKRDVIDLVESIAIADAVTSPTERSESSRSSSTGLSPATSLWCHQLPGSSGHTRRRRGIAPSPMPSCARYGSLARARAHSAKPSGC